MLISLPAIVIVPSLLDPLFSSTSSMRFASPLPPLEDRLAQEISAFADQLQSELEASIVTSREPPLESKVSLVG